LNFVFVYDLVLRIWDLERSGCGGRNRVASFSMIHYQYG